MMEEWLMRTRVLQRTAYGVDPARLTGKEREEYIRWNVLAATDELHEALGELSWKPWTTEERFNRDKFINEIVDVLHFVANLAVSAGCTDAELAARYNEKMQRNAARQADGYDDDGKCSFCGVKWVDLQHIGGKRHALSTVCADCAEIQ